MSSNEDDYGLESHRGKKRRIARACDVCRRRKSRCDGSQMEGDKCSTCIDANLECTYLEAATKRTPARSNYIESLEARLERSEAQIRTLRAELATAHFAHSSPAVASVASPCASTDSNAGASGGAAAATGAASEIDTPTASLHILRLALKSLSEPPPPPTAEDLEHLDIARKLEKLRVGDNTEVRFLGKSSNVALVKTAIDLKADVSHREERRRASESGSSPESHAVHLNGNGKRGYEPERHRRFTREAEADDEDEDEGSVKSGGGLAWTSRRLQYWTYKPWENTTIRTHTYTFPPLALMHELVNLYFQHVNVYLPLLHRPTFERGIREGLFLRDDPYAATVLLVCAIASRWHSDPRVGAPGGIGVGLDDRYGRSPVSEGILGDVPGSNAPHHHPPLKLNTNGPLPGLACGWAWFDQVPLVGAHMFGQAGLHDLQYYALAVQFLEGSSAPQCCWTIIGIGLRLAQDLGVHRRSAYIEKPSVEREQFKRAFWVLVYQDRNVSSGMGRPCALHYDDFDIDLPVECDDEYWEHPTHPFQQPIGVPSKIAFFNALIGLNHILSFALKILYSLGKVKDFFHLTESWEEAVVAELDSALNGWRDKVPEHLRWDPSRADPVFFDQSAALQCGYYHLQILVHRPFIPMMRKKAPTALPSLAICTSAARSCANVVDVQRRRKGDVPVVFNFYAVFTSGIVLLLNVWSGKRTGLAPDPTREIANVQKCMDVVKVCEYRWQHAGLLWDILAELASVGQLPLPHGQVDPKADGMPNGHTHARYSSYPVKSEPEAIRTTFDRVPTTTAAAAARASPTQYAHPQAQHPPFYGSFAGAVGMGNGPPTFGPSPMEPSAFAPAPAPETWDPPPDPFAGMPQSCGGGASSAPVGDQPMQAAGYAPQTQAQAMGGGDMLNLIDQETIAMWASAPIGLEVDDWGNYFNNFSELTQGQGQGQGQQLLMQQEYGYATM
ncbi:Zn(2)-C6 fungal-type domain-containing protein [Mycena kentingensis (nom. inval.)]|nr:Zn(2)-C6 fungal-type domain-containing protein [Mycena kentingensis (nom. inval.)]